ncbi:hypothetical protein M422DRAFT_179907, partial [Sphaerobolus stellatus SS14]
VLEALTCPEVYNSYIMFLNNDSPVPDQIRQNPKYFPFLKGVLGAIDGSHLPARQAKTYWLLVLLICSSAMYYQDGRVAHLMVPYLLMQGSMISFCQEVDTF